jgi:hypothetical protein
MKSYSLSYPSGTILDSDGNVIPKDDREAAYLEYVSWLSAGNTPAVEQDPPDSDPELTD